MEIEMGKHHTKEQALEKLKVIREMKKKGVPVSKIAKHLNIRPTTTYHWEYKYGKFLE